MLIVVWTGQRQGDILSLTWRQYDGEFLRLKQGKTRRHLKIKVAAPLRAVLETARARLPDTAEALSRPVCCTAGGGRWTGDGYRAVFNRTRVQLGITNRTVYDLRGTAITRRAQAGCTVPEIASITGYSLKDVEAILDAHYLSRDSALAETAIRKLEKHVKRTAAVKRTVKRAAGKAAG